SIKQRASTIFTLSLHDALPILPVARLTAVFRQAAQSRIVTTAHRINQGHVPDLRRPAGESDFYFVEVDDPETAVTRLIDLVRDRDRKSTRLNSSHDQTSYAVFC